MKRHDQDLALFGLPAAYSAEELKAAWRRVAFETHPDREGDIAKFHAAGEAHARLVAALRRRRCSTCDGLGTVQARRKASFMHAVACPTCKGAKR